MGSIGDMAQPELIAAVGARTGQIVELLGVSQRTLAARIGVSASFLSAVIAGKSQASIQMLIGLRREYGVSLDWYLLGRGVPFEATHHARKPDDELVDHLLPAVLELGPEARGRVIGFLEGMLAASADRRRAQAG